MTPLAAAIPDPDALLAEILRRCTNPSSFIHGPGHWRGVAHAGLRLAQRTPEADATVVLLFALFHDSMRLDDGHDPQHGPRAAEFARTLHGSHFHLPPDRLKWLLLAIRDHTEGRLAPNPTVACCWDADRLNLWRIHVRPDPKYLSTPAAQEPEAIDWAGRLEGQGMRWGEIFEGYHAAEVAARAAAGEAP
ncbi:MAG TPA: hypothetical protein VF796_18720 [Humisphaera sp.]